MTIQRVVLGIAISLLLASGCIVQPNEPGCPIYTECAECLEHSGCGFCVSQNRHWGCAPGTSFGPDDDTVCPDSDWRFTSCDEPPPVLECAAISGCSECIATKGCGYCHPTYDCRSLDHTLGCILDTYAESRTCREADCHAETSCADCTQREGCGYCLAERECQLMETSYCVLATDPDSFICAADECSNIESCEECASQDDCGWCSDAGECRHVEYSEECRLERDPDSTICEEERCHAASSCEECMENRCNWCYSLSECMASRDTCTFLEHMILWGDECPPNDECPTHTNCSDCASIDGCAWCHEGLYRDGEFLSGCIAVDEQGEPYGYEGVCFPLTIEAGSCE